MDIKCIGYKKAFTGKKMWYYKLLLNGNEYCIIDAGMIKLLDMIWTDKNEFANADFTDDVYDEIEKQIKKVKKVETLLEVNEGENSFFTQHEIKPEPEVEVIPRKG